MPFKPMKRRAYERWIKTYGWSLEKGSIDWNLIDEFGNWACAVKVTHPGNEVPPQACCPNRKAIERTRETLMRSFPKLKDTFSKAVLEELRIALAEVGTIEPWEGAECAAWVFHHPLYPTVEYSGDSKDEVMTGYPFYLAEFIKHRLANRIHPQDNQATSGRGGRRPGAGRPKKGLMKRKYLPADVAAWLDDEENLEKVRKLMG